MTRKKLVKTKPNTPKTKPPVQEDVKPSKSFHLSFPVHLSYKDGDDLKDCYFKDEIDLQKHITRYKLKNYAVQETQPRS